MSETSAINNTINITEAVRVDTRVPFDRLAEVVLQGYSPF
jgi:hypothetical protein